MSLRILVNPSPLRTQVVERLRNAIVDGELAVGVRLIERELIEQLGVSRPSVREALRQLESEGLIIQTSTRGVEIPILTAKEITEIYQVRIALEGLAAELFTRYASDDMVDQLRKALVQIEKAREQPTDRKLFREAKGQFYNLLLVGADNSTAARALRTYHLRLALLWASAPTVQDKKARKAEMRAIVDAIASRDEAAAKAAYTIHLTNSLQEALRSVDESASTEAHKRASLT